MEKKLKIQVGAGGGGVQRQREMGLKECRESPGICWDYCFKFAWTLKDNLESGSTQI